MYKLNLLKMRRFLINFKELLNKSKMKTENDSFMVPK